MVRIALAQINPVVGDLKYNCDKIISYIKKAKKKGVELVVFPELALTGCPPEDLLLKKNFISKNKQCLDVIRKACSGITALVGFVDEKQGDIYNSCAVIQDKKVQDIYREMIFPANGVFDEKRYFSTGDSLSLYTFKNYKFAISICEDIRKESFVELLKVNNVDFIINLSASPFHLGKVSKREKALSYVAKRVNSFIFYCNLIGGQDEVVFDGTSKIFSPQGKLVAHAKRFNEDLLIFNLNKSKKYLPKKIKDKEEEEAFLALHLGLSDYFEKNNFKKAIVGVSGGIDSAVVIALAKIVLGKDNVCALIMPSRYTSEGTFKDAKRICENLGVKYHIMNIDEALDTYIKNLKPHFKGKKPDKTEENLQARIRGNFLMAFSNKFGHIVLNTGNKSETSCGYCTLYGDMVGGFGVLCDVPKRLVFKLAYYMNKIMGKNFIPVSIIKRPPSAELKPNQKDSDSLPPYNLLDPILKLYVEDDLSLDEIVKKGHKRSLVEKIIKMVDANEYKRRQAPIGIKITPKAFGKDRRMPVTNRFSQ